VKKALGEEQLAVPLYSDFYGAVPYQRMAVTQQAAMNYGQSFASIVFLPITSFFDATTRERLGFHNPLFFESVGPHEIAHQWWGNTVGWISYRDQWMSEVSRNSLRPFFFRHFTKTAPTTSFGKKSASY